MSLVCVGLQPLVMGFGLVGVGVTLAGPLRNLGRG